MEHQQIVDSLLWPAWRGIPGEYKAKYARNIWQQFEDNIRSAAYTSSLRRCFEALSLRLNISIGTEDIRSVTAILTSGEDREILRTLRDETTTLVLMVRVKNDERKAAYQRERTLTEELDRRLRPGESPVYTEDEIGSLFGPQGGAE